jgi:hypothetical protein
MSLFVAALALSSASPTGAAPVRDTFLQVAVRTLKEEDNAFEGDRTLLLKATAITTDGDMAAGELLDTRWPERPRPDTFYPVGNDPKGGGRNLMPAAVSVDGSILVNVEVWAVKPGILKDVGYYEVEAARKGALSRIPISQDPVYRAMRYNLTALNRLGNVRIPGLVGRPKEEIERVGRRFFKDYNDRLHTREGADIMFLGSIHFTAWNSRPNNYVFVAYPQDWETGVNSIPEELDANRHAVYKDNAPGPRYVYRVTQPGRYSWLVGLFLKFNR